MGGDDQLRVDDSSDTLDGGDGRDRIVGGAGHDRLVSGQESDELIGGTGEDILVGGAGADAFMVSLDSGDDVVLDFFAIGDAQGTFDHIAFMDISSTATT